MQHLSDVVREEEYCFSPLCRQKDIFLRNKLEINDMKNFMKVALQFQLKKAAFDKCHAGLFAALLQLKSDQMEYLAILW